MIKAEDLITQMLQKMAYGIYDFKDWGFFLLNQSQTIEKVGFT